MTQATRTGRCLCGAVSFTLAVEPLATRVCWCRDCQHLAANGTVNLVVPAEALADETLRLARRLAAGPTLAYGHYKRLAAEAFSRPLPAAAFEQWLQDFELQRQRWFQPEQSTGSLL